MPTRDLAKNLSTIKKPLLRLESAFEREVLKNYYIAREKVKTDLATIFEKYSREGKLTYAEMTKYNRLGNMEKQISDELLAMYNVNGRTITRLSEDAYEASYFRHGWAIEQTAGIDMKWGLLNKDTIRAAVANPLEKIALEGIKKNGLVGIRRTVASGLTQGTNYPKMARMINKYMDSDAKRAITIVRTEGQRAQVLGQLSSYDYADEQGIEMRKVWDATLDKYTRPEHGALDGIAADKEGYWHVPGIGLVVGPLQSGDAAFDINCRCSVRAEIKEYAPSVRRIRDEGIKPWENFTSWGKRHNLKKNIYGQKYDF